MLLDGVIHIIDVFLTWILGKIPDLNLDLTDFYVQFNLLVEKGQALNAIFPISEALGFIAIGLSIKIALMAFWASMRLINLIRGAG